MTIEDRRRPAEIDDEILYADSVLDESGDDHVSDVICFLLSFELMY
jgi:hypothetical protein